MPHKEVIPLVLSKVFSHRVMSAGDNYRFKVFISGLPVHDRHWWVQAENVVGHVDLYQHFDDEVALRKAFG